MRLMIDNAEYELFSVIQSLKKDKDSWEDWMCLRILMPEMDAHPERSQMRFNLSLVLDGHLNSKYGSIFFLGYKEILVFGKDLTESLLTDIGTHIVNQIIQDAGCGAYFKIFDLVRDHDRLTDDYHLEDFVTSNVVTYPDHVPQDVLQYPDFDDDQYFNPGHPNSKRVLLVEDDPVTRWMVRTAVKGTCDLMTAPTACRALSMYKDYKPDLVLLDINLPDISGHEILVQIMNRDPGAYIVMFSSQDSIENITNTMEDGARGFIAKPFRKERLLQYIESCPSAH